MPLLVSSAAPKERRIISKPTPLTPTNTNFPDQRRRVAHDRKDAMKRSKDERTVWGFTLDMRDYGRYPAPKRRSSERQGSESSDAHRMRVQRQNTLRQLSAEVVVTPRHILRDAMHETHSARRLAPQVPLPCSPKLRSMPASPVSARLRGITKAGQRPSLELFPPTPFCPKQPEFEDIPFTPSILFTPSPTFPSTISPAPESGKQWDDILSSYMSDEESDLMTSPSSLETVSSEGHQPLAPAPAPPQRPAGARLPSAPSSISQGSTAVQQTPPRKKLPPPPVNVRPIATATATSARAVSRQKMTVPPAFHYPRVPKAYHRPSLMPGTGIQEDRGVKGKGKMHEPASTLQRRVPVGPIGKVEKTARRRGVLLA